MNKPDPSSFRRHALLSTTVLVSAFAAYSRSAYAACVPDVAPSYLCSGTETDTQTINANNAAVSTLPGFSVDTTLSGGNAITITGDGELSYTDINASPLTADETALFIHSTGDDGGTPGSVTVETNGALSGGTYGIDARNAGSGALTVTVTGDVTGDSAVGIRARNYTGTNPIPYWPYAAPYADGTDVTVVTGVGTTVTGGDRGIEATNWGSGALTITANGDVASGDYGIRARNYGDGDSTITTGPGTTVTGARGMDVRNVGAGALTITADGDVVSLFGGIRAIQTSTTGQLNVTINGDVTNTYGTALSAERNSAGNVPGVDGVTIAIHGNLRSTFGNGIVARNVDGGDIAIGVYGDITAGSDGISATTVRGGHLDIVTGVGTTITASGGIDARADGHLTITTNGDVLGVFDGIEARSYNSYGTADATLTIVANGRVTGRFGAIDATNFGTGILSITVAGDVSSSDGEGIYAERQYGDGGVIEIVVESTAVVEGGETGIEIASNSGLSTVNNAGIIRNASGATDDAAIVSTRAGDVVITNTGTIIGTVTLGDGNDTFNEQSFNSWHTAGGTNDFGAGANVINNDGLIVAAEPGAPASVTTIFQATGGTLAFNSNLGGELRLRNGVVGDIAQIGNAGDFNGTFVANGGIVTLDVELGGDASPTDMLVIDGDTVLGTGATWLQVANVGGTGGQTVNGIKLVDVTGNSAAGVFTLLGDYEFQGEQVVVGGAYLYGLYQGTPTLADGDWYLRSLDAFQAGVPLYEAYANVLQGFNQLDTLQQRVGNRAWGDGVIEGEGIWGRVKATHGRFDPSTSTTGADYQVSIWELQAGIDGVLADGDAGQLVAGVNVRGGVLGADITSIYGDGSIGGTGFGLGATLTFYGESGFYLDGQAQVSWYDSTLTSSTADRVLVEGNDGFGYGLSLEAGQKIALGPNWSLTPQAQLAFSEVAFAGFTDSFGAAVAFGHSRSLRGRLGISADFEDSWQDDAGETSHAHLYAIANLYYDFIGGSEADLDGISLASQNDPLWGGVGIGGTYSWGDDKYALHGEALVNTSLANPGSNLAFTGTAGLKVKW